jgi:hypothetical protein
MPSSRFALFLRTTGHAAVQLAMSLVLTAALSGCGSTDALSPAAAPPIALPAAVARLAVTIDVATTASLDAVGRTTLDPTVRAATEGHAPWAFASLLGVDGVTVEVGRVDRSVLGRFAPGKVRVVLGIRLHNVLDRTILLTPTFPSPPAGAGIYLFAVQSVAVETPGTVTVSGNTVLVEAPSHGAVAPGPEWEGTPYDYLRGASSLCTPSVATCALWERFAAPMAAGGVSEWRTVSYDIDPTVHHMRLRFVVAADLTNADR